ncbi:MAG: hypothetical protein H0T60_12060 [Acidobacteria bacterium]|nr:hypothetical protein [Acidobacteriota bacterium]
MRLQKMRGREEGAGFLLCADSGGRVIIRAAGEEPKARREYETQHVRFRP